MRRRIEDNRDIFSSGNTLVLLLDITRDTATFW
jgi:hypothetical protein